MPRGLDSPRQWRPSAEGNARLRAGYPLNEAERGIRAPRDALVTRLPPVGTGSAVASGNQPAPRSGRAPAARMSKSKSVPTHRNGRMDVAQPRDAGAHTHTHASPTLPGMSEITGMLETQYAAIVSIARAVKAAPPPQHRTLPPIDMGAMRAENIELRRVADRQQAEIERLRAALTQIQGASAAAAGMEPNRASQRPLPSVRREGSPSPPEASSASPIRETAPTHPSAASPAAMLAPPPQPAALPSGSSTPVMWVAVLGPLARRKDEFCTALAERLGGSTVATVTSGEEAQHRAVPPDARQMLRRAIGAMRGGRGPFVLVDLPRTPSQLADLSGAVGPPLALLQVDLAGLEDRRGWQVTQRPPSNGPQSGPEARLRLRIEAFPVRAPLRLPTLHAGSSGNLWRRSALRGDCSSSGCSQTPRSDRM